MGASEVFEGGSGVAYRASGAGSEGAPVRERGQRLFGRSIRSENTSADVAGFIPRSAPFQTIMKTHSFDDGLRRPQLMCPTILTKTSFRIHSCSHCVRGIKRSCFLLLGDCFQSRFLFSNQEAVR